jgi:TolB-like protein/DNA-binding winged helix-turn-helix (wHTH) protein
MRIGEWQVDPEQNQISRDGVNVRLEMRTMEVLLCLARSAGHAVSVEQLLDAVWKDVIVTPDSVYQAVAALRRALGDDSKEPRYIANVPRRGYRLIAAVVMDDSPAIVQAAPEQPTAPPAVVLPTSSLASRRWPWILALTILIVGGTLLLILLRQTPALGSSVAVLPFDDLSPAKDQQYLADGLAAELVDRLSRIPGLHVASRSATAYFRGRQATVADVSKMLHVDYLLEGSIRKSGESVRVSAQLVRGADGYEVWSAAYDRSLADVFEVQDVIAANLVQEMRLSITPVPMTKDRRLTDNADAHVEFLRALPAYNSGTAAGYDAASDHLRSALQLDPKFASAWGLLSQVTIWRSQVHGLAPDAEVCGTARAAAQRAVEFDNLLPTGHRAMGILLQSCDHDLPGADREFQQALALLPTDSTVLMSAAQLKCAQGQPDEALKYAQRAIDVDPFNSWTFANLGNVHLYAGRPVEAETALRRALDIDVSTGTIHSELAVTLLTNNNAAEAVIESQREPDPQIRATLLPIVLDAAGRSEDAEHSVLDLKERFGTVNEDWIGLFYACRHDAPEAVKWLRAYAAKHPQWAEYQPRLQGCLRSLEGQPIYEQFRQQSHVQWARSACNPWW